MSFNLVTFIKQRGTHFVTDGPNVARGHINIRCPMCRDDPSEHMGIRIADGVWGCWRDSTHRGRAPHRLIRAITSWPWHAVEELITSQETLTTPETWDQLAAKLRDEPELPDELTPMEMPNAFKPIDDRGLRGRFWDYLWQERGFWQEDVAGLSHAFNLRCALVGPWGYRLIMPLTVAGVLVGWTARSIARSNQRYLSYPPGDSLKQILFNQDALLEGGLLLVIVEGPMDVMKVDWYGRDRGFRSVGLMHSDITDHQVITLLEAKNRFERVLVLMDEKAEKQGFDVASKLSLLHPKVGQMEGDPGDLPPKLVVPLLNQYSWGR